VSAEQRERHHPSHSRCWVFLQRDLWSAIRDLGLTRRPFAEERGGGGSTSAAPGLTRDLVTERLCREAIFVDVAQGVSEIQQIIVGRELLADTAR
jgi:alkylation response protein AidB-like acyl-CoA dehydrogenase